MTANQPSSSPSLATQGTAQHNQQSAQSTPPASKQQQRSQLRPPQPQQQQQQQSKQVQSSEPAFSALPSSDTTVPDVESKPKLLGSTRRGKQYKCGNCHELGHNQYVFEYQFYLLHLLHSFPPFCIDNQAFHPHDLQACHLPHRVNALFDALAQAPFLVRTRFHCGQLGDASRMPHGPHRVPRQAMLRTIV